MEVDDVIAHAVYDPVARRQRYLKSRQLKGRQPGIGKTLTAHVGGRPRPGSPSAGNHVNDKSHVNRTAVMQAASNARQVAAIRGRLSDLKAHLSELLAQKKAEATSSKKTPAKKTSTPAKPKTAKQKAAAKKALKKAQAARAKTQKATTSLSLDEQITKTRAVITDVETKLRAVVDSARTQTASNSR